MPTLNELFSWLIPFGIFGAMIFPAILAHRGYRNQGTWLLLIGAILYFALNLINRILFHLLKPLATPMDWDFYELYLYFVFFAVGVSLFIYSLGILSLGRYWKTLSHRAATLELEVEKLAEQANTSVMVERT